MMALKNNKTKKLVKEDAKFISPSLTRELPFAYAKGYGNYLWDVDGKKYLDFSAAVAVANVGHNNKEVAKAIKHQLKYGVHAAFSDFYADIPVKFVKTLIKFLPKHLNMAFLSNSGTESVEAAYKLAKWHSNRKWVIAFTGAFHGRTMGSLSMTSSKPVQRERFGPFLPVEHVPYPYYYRMKMQPETCSEYCLYKLEKAIMKHKGNVAAIFIEPILGEHGYVVPPKSFIKGVRSLCDEHNILLCDDEVQAGCYRTGKFLAIENFNVKPDVVSLSKALSNGLPIGVTVANKKLMDWPAGAHANTFGGNLLACAAGIATLKYMKKNKLGENAKRTGNYIIKYLNELKDKYAIIGDVRGIGLMIGIEISKKGSTKPDIKTRDKILHKCFNKGLLMLPAGDSVIRICPPLTITQKEADKGLEIIENVIKIINK